MLQSEELDKDSFEEILQRAIVKIPQIYPAWTDFNSSDPGIMILELMSYFTEVSEYHLNRIDEDNYRKYLKLLGKTPGSRTPARTWLRVNGKGKLPQNTEFYAEDIPFATEYEIDVNENEIVSIKSGTKTLENKNNLFSDLQSRFTFSPFEYDEENSGVEFEIELKKSVYPENVVGIYVQIKEWKNTKAFDDDFIEYVKYHCEIFDDIWKKGVEILVDETKGFCRSGIIILKITEKMSGGRKLRFVIDQGEYPVNPVITGILWNVVPALQKAAHTETIDLGLTYGICGEHMKFDKKDCIADSIKLYVLEKTGKVQWSCVKDFDESDSLSRHFIYDEKSGDIIFGDGVHGRAPKGRVYIEGYETTAGAEGNIKESVLKTLDEENWSAVNILPATGGRAAQSIEDCFEELKQESNVPKRCVSLEDYEKAVRNTPGVPVHRVKAFRGAKRENTICIAVEGEGKLNNRCIENLKQSILPKAMIGTNVEFVKPKYTRLYIFLEISVHPYYEGCEEKTVDAVKEYFNSEEISFGDVIKGNQLIGYLYRLPWINGIRNLELSASGSNGNAGNGRDVKLDEDCLPWVDSVTVHIVG